MLTGCKNVEKRNGKLVPPKKSKIESKKNIVNTVESNNKMNSVSFGFRERARWIRLPIWSNALPELAFCSSFNSFPASPLQYNFVHGDF